MASSKGEYFNAHIRDRYEFTRVNDVGSGARPLACPLVNGGENRGRVGRGRHFL